MRVGRLIGGGMLLSLLGAGWLAAQQPADILGAVLLGRLEAGLPPGSEVRYGTVAADPLGGSARFGDLTLRLGPERPEAPRVRAAELELTGDLGTLSTGLRARGIAGENGAGTTIRVATLEAREVAPAAILALLAGYPDVADTGPLAAEGVEFVEDDDQVRIERVAWERLSGRRLSGASIAGLSAASAGDRLELARAALGSVDWSRVDLAALADVYARQDELYDRVAARDGEATEEEEAELVMAAVETGLILADAEILGIELAGLGTVEPEGAELRAERLTIGELSRRRMGPLLLDRTLLTAEDMRLEALDLTGDITFDGLPVEAARAALPDLPRTQEGVRRLGALLTPAASRLVTALARLTITSPDDGVDLAFDTIEVDSTVSPDRETLGLEIARFALDLAGLAEEAETVPPLADSGLERVAGSFRGAWDSDRSAGRAHVRPLVLELEELASLESEGELSPSTDPLLDPEAAWDSLELAHWRLVYIDRSLVTRILRAIAGPEGPTPEQVGDAFAGVILDQAALFGLDPASSDALARFLRRPGRLEIELAPERPVAAAEIGAIIATAPATLASTLGLRISSSPPQP